MTRKMISKEKIKEKHSAGELEERNADCSKYTFENRPGKLMDLHGLKGKYI